MSFLYQVGGILIQVVNNKMASFSMLTMEASSSKSVAAVYNLLLYIGDIGLLQVGGSGGIASSLKLAASYFKFGVTATY